MSTTPSLWFQSRRGYLYHVAYGEGSSMSACGSAKFTVGLSRRKDGTFRRHGPCVSELTDIPEDEVCPRCRRHGPDTWPHLALPKTTRVHGAMPLTSPQRDAMTRVCQSGAHRAWVRRPAGIHPTAWRGLERRDLILTTKRGDVEFVNLTTRGLYWRDGWITPHPR